MKKISLKKAKRKWKAYEARIALLECLLEKCENNRTSSIANKRQFDKYLTKVIKAGRTGVVKKYDKKSIRLLTSCSAKDAKAILEELVYLGYAERRNGAIRWGKKSRYPQARNIPGVIDD